MLKKGRLFCIFIIMLIFSLHVYAIDSALPNGLNYELRNADNQVIHILTINPKDYQLKLVKAHNRVFGRETVPAMALRHNAIAAINAGFFEIGKSEDGRPSGSLMIDEKLFTLAKKRRALLAWDNQKMHMGQAKINLKLIINQKHIIFNKCNNFAEGKDIVLYNSAFGPSTLSPYDRQEVLISPQKTVTEIIPHGDNPIPNQGWVLSFPKEINLSFIKPKDSVRMDLQFDAIDAKREQWPNPDNVVMGIPLLIHHGIIMPNLEIAGGKDFAKLPHARTALGLKADGHIVMIVVENPGFTLVELAKLFLKLGCKEAINLDGGGSSTLFLNGKVINKALGDKDESFGLYTIRPVSNAIVAVKREIN